MNPHLINNRTANLPTRSLDHFGDCRLADLLGHGDKAARRAAADAARRRTNEGVDTEA